MNLEHPNTLDQHEMQETLPSFQTKDSPPSGKPRKYGWLWLVILVLVGLGVYYYFHSHPNPANAASDRCPIAGRQTRSGFRGDPCGCRRRA